MGMGGIRELLDGKIWEWDLVSDGNGNEVIEMGGNWYEKSVPAHLYLGRNGREGCSCTSGNRQIAFLHPQVRTNAHER